MENITIGHILAAIGIITPIGGFFIAIFKWFKNTFSDRFSLIEKRLDKLEERTETQEKEIKDSKEERLILIRGQLACLKGLREQGCNGPVSQAILDIEGYLVNKTHE